MKQTLTKYEELWNKIINIIRSVTKTSAKYNEKYMKIKYYSNDHLPQKKTLKLYNMIIVVRSVFHEGKKYYQQVFLDESLYQLQMIKYDRINLNKTTA